ncbi:MAG: lytic transglycosylase F [Gammaproteobacteria bacterium]|nr:lytic transglycosylase F [Gammaproteobacteria bacterium]
MEGPIPPGAAARRHGFVRRRCPAVLAGLVAIAGLAGLAAARDSGTNAAGASGADASAVIYRMTQKDRSDIGPQKRAIRVLVHFSRTKFFVADGRPRGFEYDLLKEFEAFYNRGRKRGQVKIPVIFIPVRFDQLIPMLREGRGDVAAGLLTITEARKQRVQFTLPYIRNVAEVVIAHTGAPTITAIEDLGGRKVHVLRGSSFAERLRALNRRLWRSARPRVRIVEIPSDTSTEDLLEMVNAGIFLYAVADDYMGNLWAQVLPHLRVLDVRLSERNDIAWAVRPNNPRLLHVLNDFIDEGKDQLPHQAAELHHRYFRNVDFLRNNLDPGVVGRKKHLAPHFQAASERNGFDWLFLMAQGFQESRLNQAARSRAGAVGIMQLLPSTGRQMGYPDVATSARANIAAGAKYMRHLIDQYFDEPGLPAAVRFDFALAAYNAGPTRIEQLRRLAAQRGLDPNRWFHNVERIALEKVGRQPVQYVANIHRYYTAYRLAEEMQADASVPQ